MRLGLGTSAWKYLPPISSARACFERLLCSRASPSNTLLPLFAPHPPCLAALLQHSSPLPSLASWLLQKPPHLESLLQLFSHSPSSPHVLLSIYMLFCPPQLAPPSAAPCSAHNQAALGPSREAQSPCSETHLRQTHCFHHDAVPWSHTATTAGLPLLPRDNTRALEIRTIKMSRASVF